MGRFVCGLVGYGLRFVSTLHCLGMGNPTLVLVGIALPSYEFSIACLVIWVTLSVGNVLFFGVILPSLVMF
jgi:hypothetical protein